MTSKSNIVGRIIGIALIVIGIFIGGCKGNKDQPDTGIKSKEENTIGKRESLASQKPIVNLKLKQNKNIKVNLESQIDSFASSILKENKRILLKDDLKESGVGHLSIFSKMGLKNHYAYSDKRYPKNSQPTYYENFTLFVLEYDSEKSASNSFSKVYVNSKLNNDQMDSLRNSNPNLLRSINTSLKPGGLICQRNNYVLSLIKTCSRPPIKNNWREYEDVFIRSISTDGKTINTLNAKCGMMKYNFEKRKPTDIK